MRRRRAIVDGGLLVLLAATSSQVLAERRGITTDSFGPDGCNECHDGGNAPTVEVLGPAFMRPSSTHEFTVRIGASGEQVMGGLNVSAAGGALAIGGKNSAKTIPVPNQSANAVEITHQDRKAAKKGFITFSFLWTAPAEFSSADLSVWGNAVNNNGASNGDGAARVQHRVDRGEFGLCPGAPTACAAAAKTSLAVTDSADDGKDRLTFSWSRGPEVSAADFGNPTTDTDYYLCLYKDGALVAEVDIPGGTNCGGAPCWKPKGDPAAPSAFLYKDKAGAPAGVRSVTLTPGGNRQAKVSLKATGADLPDPLLGLPVQGSSVTAELHNTSTEACFGDTYSGDDITQDDGSDFKAAGSSR